MILPATQNKFPLIVDADAVLAFTVPFQGFKAVAWQGRQVRQRGGSFEPVQFQASWTFDS